MPPSSVESLHLVPDLAAGLLKLTVNARTPVGATRVAVTVSDGGRTLATARGLLGAELTKGVRENLAWYKARLIWVTTDIPVPMNDARPWTPDSPVLYDVTVQLLGADGVVLDSVRSYVGMRSIAVGRDERGIPRPFLNGRPIMLPGALDQGFWPDGLYTAATDDALRFDLKAAKQLGLVAVRKHLKIEPERYYYWADRLGLLILQDLPSGQDGDPFTDLPSSPEASSACEMERRLLIQSRWNHPSIFAWALFNEGWGQHDTLRQARWAKELDPTRLIDEASGFPRHGGGDLHDTHGGDAPQDGQRICLDSETAGFGLAALGHSWPGKLWATGTFNPITGGEIAARELSPLDEASKRWFTRALRGFYRGMWARRETTGTSGDFKVQLYDVETESNGFLSYDRAVWKVDPAVVARAARGEGLASNTVDLVPCAATQPTSWRFTTQPPAANWLTPAFSDLSWKEGPAGFGTPTGTARLGTAWQTGDIWLRQTFSLEAKPLAPLLRLLHDEDVEVYLNGILACQEGGFTTSYDDYEIFPDAAATLKPGPNVIAVHCHQTIGGQFIDVGLLERRNAGDYPIQPVPLSAVRVQDSFWSPRLETNRLATLWHDLKQCEENGQLHNFAKAAGLRPGEFRTRPPRDSDIYKIIEGASYMLATHPDASLEKYLDDLIVQIAAAQEPDGYLYTARRLLPPDKMPAISGPNRWLNEQASHELYVAGHLYEAGVAYFQATGKRSLLNVAIKNADLVAREFGPGKLQLPPGHQGIEIGLAKLYRVTGDRKYLDLDKFLLDLRGHPETHKLYGPYCQDHKPVVEQEEAVGHAVRAAYLYCGMAEVGALAGEADYVKALDRLWDDVVTKKLSLTGGIGPRGNGEAFGEAYELPNARAYNETCGALANALWGYRMFLLHGEARYLDVFERILYNGLLCGVSLTGDRFFYQNPLASAGGVQRVPWFGTPCCPVNLVRFLPSIPGCAYALQGDHVYVNLFLGGTARLILNDNPVQITQTTRYPWDGQVKLTVEPQTPVAFTLWLRIPGWARNQPVPGDLYRFADTTSPGFA